MSKPLFPWQVKTDPGLPFHQPSINVVGEWLVAKMMVARSIKRAFAGVYIYAEPQALRITRAEMPILFCVTHSGWYDGYLTYVINKAIFRRAGYLMMEEANLKRYPFLTWVGVFGVDRVDGRKALQGINYISARLTQERSTLWMFPQGTITHPDARPLKLFGGVASIARRVGGCAIVPIAVRYELGLEQSPNVYMRVGGPILLRPEEQQLSSREITSMLTTAMTETADKLHEDVMSIVRPRYRKILAGKGSVNKVWDQALQILNQLRGRNVE